VEARDRQPTMRRIDDEVQSVIHTGHREGITLTLKTGSVYHVMNNTFIHLRVKSPNIYMYKRGRIYKEPP
jgi:hypothetical protein